MPLCLGKVIKIASYGATLIPAGFQQISNTSLIPIISTCRRRPYGSFTAAIKTNLHDVLEHLYHFREICLKSCTYCEDEEHSGVLVMFSRGDNSTFSVRLHYIPCFPKSEMIILNKDVKCEIQRFYCTRFYYIF